MDPTNLDVIIVGGGPAGLSAALVLGRSCRSVVVFDSGQYRNRAAKHLHGFLSRDGMSPMDLLHTAREQLKPYGTVRIEPVAISKAESLPGPSFKVTTVKGDVYTAKRLLLATGVVDNVPNIPGLTEMYGTSVFHCPYCDGWEVRGQRIVVYGREERAFGLALELTGWTKNIVVCSDGGCGIDDEGIARLKRNGIELREEKITRLEGLDGQIERVVFATGAPVDCRALFFTTGQTQRSSLALELGCEFNEKGTVRTMPYEMTTKPGLFVAGDASRSVQWIVVAAAEGAEAAYAINQQLIEERLKP